MTEPTTTNENPSLCSSCGGACCRTQPGIEHPGRFLAAADPVELLASQLRDQAWVLALHPWRDEITGVWAALYYPRPATILERDTCTLIATSDSGDCTFLTPNGCRLSFSDRPHLCQVLEPASDQNCQSPWGKRDAAIAWRPHQELVHAAVERLGHPPLNRQF